MSVTDQRVSILKDIWVKSATNFPAMPGMMAETEAAKLRLDQFIAQHQLEPPFENRSIDYDIAELRALFRRAHDVFAAEKSLVETRAPVTFFGNIHGQYGDLLVGAFCSPTEHWQRVLHAAGPPSDKSRYMFLGDYVDRGPYSLECVALLFALKVRHPTSVFLLRGNHELRTINYHYGLFDQASAVPVALIHFQITSRFGA